MGLEVGEGSEFVNHGGEAEDSAGDVVADVVVLFDEAGKGLLLDFEEFGFKGGEALVAPDSGDEAIDDGGFEGVSWLEPGTGSVYHVLEEGGLLADDEEAAEEGSFGEAGARGSHPNEKDSGGGLRIGRLVF